jgi:hypothetical protein
VNLLLLGLLLSTRKKGKRNEYEIVTPDDSSVEFFDAATFDLQESSPPGQEEIPISSAGEENVEEESSLENFGRCRLNWWARFEELKEFQKTKGTFVLRRADNNRSLYQWLRRQKAFVLWTICASAWGH